MNYEQKYLKYKEKYLELKKMKAGFRIMNPGPMIGYPAMPIMGPQIRVSGPIPGPIPIGPIGPFGPRLAPMPGPFILGPRMIRVTESESPKTVTCPPSPAPVSYSINLVITEAEFRKNGIPNVAGGFTTELVNTIDNKYYTNLLKKVSVAPVLKTINLSIIQTLPLPIATLLINFYGAPGATPAQISSNITTLIGNITATAALTVPPINPEWINTIISELNIAVTSTKSAATTAAAVLILNTIQIFPFEFEFDIVPINTKFGLDLSIPFKSKIYWVNSTNFMPILAIKTPITLTMTIN
jgi:hypothetical protein